MQQEGNWTYLMHLYISYLSRSSLISYCLMGWERQADHMWIVREVMRDEYMRTIYEYARCQRWHWYSLTRGTHGHHKESCCFSKDMHSCWSKVDELCVSVEKDVWATQVLIMSSILAYLMLKCGNLNTNKSFDLSFILSKHSHAFDAMNTCLLLANTWSE